MRLRNPSSPLPRRQPATENSARAIISSSNSHFPLARPLRVPLSLVMICIGAFDFLRLISICFQSAILSHVPGRVSE